jgi:hypothetical protein
VQVLATGAVLCAGNSWLNDKVAEVAFGAVSQVASSSYKVGCDLYSKVVTWWKG